MDGTEKSYMVEAAIGDMVAAYGMDDINAVKYARLSLQTDDEGSKHTFMALALKDVQARR